jgi:hypothetical protein
MVRFMVLSLGKYYEPVRTHSNVFELIVYLAVVQVTQGTGTGHVIGYPRPIANLSGVVHTLTHKHKVGDGLICFLLVYFLFLSWH